MVILPLGSGKGRPLTSTGETATALAASLEETRVGGPAQAVADTSVPLLLMRSLIDVLVTWSWLCVIVPLRHM